MRDGVDVLVIGGGCMQKVLERSKTLGCEK
jgi:hypothetical protein